MRRSELLESYLVSIAMLLGVTLSALPVCIQIPYAAGDEIKCSVPTIKFLFEHGRPPLFIYSNSYMAPVQEIVGALPFTLAGGNVNALRATGILFIALGGIVWYRFLCRVYTRRVAITTAACYALCTAPVAITRVITPGYAVGCLAAPVFLTLAYNWGLERGLWIGLMGGVLYYGCPVIVPYVIVMGALILACPLAAGRAVPLGRIRLGDWRTCLLCTGTAMLLPAIYLHFARRGSVLPAAAGASALAGIAVLLMAVVAVGVKYRDDPRLRRGVAAGVGYATGFAAICLAVGFVYEHYERPYFETLGVKLWAGNQYGFKNIRDWPYQAAALGGRILPYTLLPQLPAQPIRVYGHRHWYLRITGLILLVFLGAIAWRWAARCVPRAGPPMARLWYVAAPMSSLVLLGFLLPSWRLFGDPSLRYLILVLPGFYIAAAGALDSFRLPAGAYWSIVGAYLSLNILSYLFGHADLFMR